jgi:hypothetical protein
MPINGSNKPKLLHDTIEVRAIAHVCKLDPSYLTDAKKIWVEETYPIVLAI